MGAIGALRSTMGTVCVGRAKGVASAVCVVAGAGGVASGPGAITVGINTRVESVGSTRAVGAISTLGSAVCVVSASVSAVVGTGVVGAGAGVGTVTAESVSLGMTGAVGVSAVLAVTSNLAVGAVHVGVYTGIGSVGNAGVVGTGSAFRGAVMSRVVAVDSFLDLVDDAGHIG